MMIIDPPSPFASLSEWQRFLEEMQALPGNDPAIEENIKLARRMIDDLHNNP